MKKWMMIGVLASVFVSQTVWAQCVDSAQSALLEAKSNRGVVSDLDTMRAWYHDVGFTIDDYHRAQGFTLFDEIREDLLYGVSWMSWVDGFTGLQTCRDGMPGSARLNRGWSGAYGYTQDVKRQFGYELYYLTAKDRLVHDNETDYGWRHSVAGARAWYRDWLSLSWGRLHREGPSRNPENAPKEGGFYFNVGIPALNLSTDLVTQPNARGIDLFSVELTKLRFPNGGPSFGFSTGYYERDGKVVSALLVDDLITFLSFRGSVEYDPFRLRSLELRASPNWHKVFAPRNPRPDDLWTRFDLEPFVEVGFYRSQRAVDQIGMDWIPGAATGVSAQWLFWHVAVGGDVYVGINRPSSLDQLLSSYGRTHYGARFFLRMAI